MSVETMHCLHAGVGIRLVRFALVPVWSFSLSCRGVTGPAGVAFALFNFVCTSIVLDGRRGAIDIVGFPDTERDSEETRAAGVGVAREGRGLSGGGPIEPSMRGLMVEAVEGAFVRVLLERAEILPLTGVSKGFALSSSFPESEIMEEGRDTPGVVKTLESRLW